MISYKGLVLIKAHEGLRLKAYICPTGHPTIGYGSTRIDNKPVKLGMEITKEKAEQALHSDLDIFEKEMTPLIKVPINQHQKDALLSFVFNLGITKFKSSTLLKKLNLGDYEGAANEFERWVYGRVNGKMVVLAGLVKRRKEEKELFLKPVSYIEIDPKPNEVHKKKLIERIKEWFGIAWI